MKIGIKLGAVLCTVLLSAAMLAQSSGEPKSDETPNDKTAGDAGASWNSPDYVIGPDDTLHISVWKEPDLSETLPVRPDGKISMPLLDDIPAAGMTPVLLKELICRSRMPLYRFHRLPPHASHCTPRNSGFLILH